MADVNDDKYVASSLGEPQYTPPTWPRNPYVPWDSRTQFDHSSSGAVSIQLSHASSMGAAAAQGYCKVKSVTSGMTWTSNVRDVTTPKFPPPPPRLAQSMSAWSPSLART